MLFRLNEENFELNFVFIKYLILYWKIILAIRSKTAAGDMAALSN